MKKWVNMRATFYFLGASALGAAFAAAAAPGSTIFTGWPGTTRSTPSTTTRSPACSPDRTTIPRSPY
jgi:hypothetical protein